MESDAYHYVVYAHINKVNGKMYIGITGQEDPNLRWLNGLGYSESPMFNNAIRKYGWDSFSHVILCNGLNLMEAEETEKFMIMFFDTQNRDKGYNRAAGGQGAFGVKWTDDQKKRMSERISGKGHPNYGKHMSEETKRKIGDANRGRHYGDKSPKSEETKRKMAEGKMKPVYMCAKGNKDEIIKMFKSAKTAQEETGISRKNISECCLGHRPWAGGYSWKFA